ncbi:MAG: hypothetical protein ACRC7O_04525 [Fimbriiglobus sp.]
MPEMYDKTIPIVDDNTNADVLFHPHFGRGHDPDQVVQGMFASPNAMPLVPESEYSARCKEQKERGSGLGDMYLRDKWVNLDQNGHGYCWAYSVGHAMMIKRMSMGLPHVRLNPHGVAAVIKNGRDEGGWCGLSAEYATRIGFPSDKHWPGHSRSMANKTPDMLQNSAMHRATGVWMDLAKAAYDQDLSRRQLLTCLFNGDACAVDFNWWGHSVCALQIVEIEAGSFGLMILNSWANWGERGLAVLRGGKAVPDGAIGLFAATASAA